MRNVKLFHALTVYFHIMPKYNIGKLISKLNIIQLMVMNYIHGIPTRHKTQTLIKFLEKSTQNLIVDPVQLFSCTILTKGLAKK